MYHDNITQYICVTIIDPKQRVIKNIHENIYKFSFTYSMWPYQLAPAIIYYGHLGAVQQAANKKTW